MHSILQRAMAALLIGGMVSPAFAAASDDLKAAATANIDIHAKLAQQMVDTVFSYAEPGFQEYRTSAYLTDILKKNGFKITMGVAGIPTAWTATWGEDGPLIALGSDEDDLRGLSQVPGDPHIKPLVPGAPGHGEGHNSGMPLQVIAALAVKAVMEKNHLKGRLMLWLGIAEELLGAKAFYVRAGLFKDVDACIFVHVSSSFGTGWGPGQSSGMVSVLYSFHGRTAHAAADPWDGRSALDAAELMDVMWNFRREHLPLSQRSHDVIVDGGGQPNIVPDHASVWYYFRDHDFASVRSLYDIGNTIADAAAMATGTTVTHKLLGTAAPGYGNRPMAEDAYENIKLVGMPQWSDDDRTFNREIHTDNGLKQVPLETEVASPDSLKPRPSLGGPSDDIGDIMWNVPTITILYPANVPGIPFHNVIAAMAMTTPIAHKGVISGAKAVAMTVLDLMTKPALLTEAKNWFHDVQLKDQKYVSMLSPEDEPDIHVNDALMKEMRPKMEPYYYDAKKYPTYLDQLGIKYPNPPAN